MIRHVVVLTMASILALHAGTAFGSTDSARWVVLASADFDGDGRDDKVLGGKTAVTGAYHTIEVESGVGKDLLHIESDQFFQSAQVGERGFARPVLVTTQAAGGNMKDVRAFVYAPSTGRLEPVKWGDGQQVATALRVKVKPGAIVLYTWEGTPTTYWFQGDRLLRKQ